MVANLLFFENSFAIGLCNLFLRPTNEFDPFWLELELLIELELLFFVIVSEPKFEFGTLTFKPTF